MSTVNDSTKHDDAKIDEVTPPSQAYAEIVQLARQGVSQHQFLTQSLRYLAKYFSSPYAAIHVRYGAEVIHDDWHTGPNDPKFWKSSVQQFLTESLGEPKARAKLLRAKSGGGQVAFASAPIFDPTGPATGAIALVLMGVKENELVNQLTVLESAVRLISFSAEFLGVSPDQRASQGQAGSGDAAAQSRALGQAGGVETFSELAFKMTNELCNKLGCESVALGAVTNQHIKVISISGMDTINSRSPGIACLRSAMEECLDAGTAVVYQKEEKWSSGDLNEAYWLHKSWHTATGGDNVASIPLQTDTETVAILSFHRGANKPFEREEIENMQLKLAPYASALRLLGRADRNIVRHVVDGVKHVWHALWAPGKFGLRLGTIALAIAIGVFLFGSMPYNVQATCRVVPRQSINIGARFDSKIASAVALVGDRVSKGDILCTLDQTDLVMHQSELKAELQVLNQEVDRARAQGEPVESKLIDAKRMLVQAKLNIVNRQIEQSVIRSPIDGVVVAGDLRMRIDTVVAKGAPLYQVAPLHEWKLVINVPEQSSDRLDKNLSGSFSAYARPGSANPFQVVRVMQSARIQNGQNIIAVEATIEEPADWLRPGMEGVARIRMGSKRIWWLTFHRMIEYIQLNLWP